MATKLTATLVALASALAATSARADCVAGEATVFACQTAQGKRIEVCDAGKTLTYSFGRPQAQPEIMLRVARERASTSQWNGLGRFIAYSVDIPNGDTVYSVFWGADRLSDDHPIEAGVEVLVKGRLAATVRCADGEIVQAIEGLDLKPTD